MVLHNPNNWHWVNKDVAPWARSYLDTNLTTIATNDNGVTASIEKVLSMEGDVDVSQRKGKVITLFDVKLKLEYSGTTSSAETVKGSITVPEVAHDTEEDEYVFEIDIYSDTSSKQPVKDLVRAKILPQLRVELHKLAPALIAEHGKDIQHSKSEASSGAATARTTTTSSSHLNKESGNSSATSTSTVARSHVNTTTVIDTEEFQTTAAQLYQTFTDRDRLAAFTRSPLKVFEGAKKGGKFELFGGNVSGEYVELVEPTKIVQRWRLKQWPEGHYSSLAIQFDQNDQDGVTVMRVNWEGVPIGQEEVTKRNWQEYYVRCIKTTFGFGAVLS